MSNHTVYNCDECGKRLDYIDAGGDFYVQGFDALSPLSVNVHVSNQYGYSGYPIDPLYFENICSPKCLKKRTIRWLDKVCNDNQWISYEDRVEESK